VWCKVSRLRKGPGGIVVYRLLPSRSLFPHGGQERPCFCRGGFADKSLAYPHRPFDFPFPRDPSPVPLEQPTDTCTLSSQTLYLCPSYDPDKGSAIGHLMWVVVSRSCLLCPRFVVIHPSFGIYQSQRSDGKASHSGLFFFPLCLYLLLSLPLSSIP